MLVYQRVYDLMEHGVLVYTSDIIGLTLAYSDSWSEPYTCGPIGCPQRLATFRVPAMRCPPVHAPAILLCGFFLLSISSCIDDPFSFNIHMEVS